MKFILVTSVLLMLSICTKKHPLSVLLLLEVLVLVILLHSMIIGVEIFYCLMLICVGACEGAIGLGALIGLRRIRTHV